VYLTQVFQQVEAMPLYRYLLRLRLSRALDLLGEYDDLTALGRELGFSIMFISAQRSVNRTAVRPGNSAARCNRTPLQITKDFDCRDFSTMVSWSCSNDSSSWA
jgi:hypothetical protein